MEIWNSLPKLRSIRAGKSAMKLSKREPHVTGHLLRHTRYADRAFDEAGHAPAFSVGYDVALAVVGQHTFKGPAVCVGDALLYETFAQMGRDSQHIVLKRVRVAEYVGVDALEHIAMAARLTGDDESVVDKSVAETSGTARPAGSHEE